MKNAQDPYWAWHRHLEFTFGKAKEFQCTNCNAQALDWALKPEYSDILGARAHVERLDAYHPLCRSCHLKQDAIHRQLDESKRATISAAQRKRFAEQGVSDETRARMSEANKGKKRTPEQRENYRRAARVREARIHGPL